MKTKTLLLTAAAALLVPAAVLAPQATAGPAPAAKAPTYKANTFERPAAGNGYPLGQWATDGWTAPWQQGMETRARIDDTTPAHGGSKSLRIHYPKGKIGPEDSGAQAPFALTKAREYYLSFWVKFSGDFSWGTTEYAGKVGLGLAGGASCSGGQVCDGTNGFSSRMIWRQNNGQAAVYYYHMGHAGQYGDYAVLKKNGADIHWPKNQWVNVAQRVKVNTVTGGNANPDGEIEVFYNGRSAAKVTGLRFVTNNDQVDRAYFSSFAGGATPSFAPNNDNSFIWYDDLKVSTDRNDICELSTCT
ncbi:polysaccharide lyase [Streptomyces rubiginosohelvolus]|uniref:polysaccharide lyase n=1 Tax=Streptomyces rubiginosohelvolus TaxID=67362 RepID=UPI003667FF22